MRFPQVLICTLTVAVALVAPVVSADGAVSADSAVAPAADAAGLANYQVGQRLKAKQACTIKGYAIKKNVILTVAAVHKDDQGKVGTVDLTFSGMTISNVDVNTVAANFIPA